MYSETVNKLINQFEKLPGIGHKTAVRLAFYILESDENVAKEFSETLVKAKKNVKFCSICYNLTEKDPCDICSNSKRDESTICVVENVKDVIAMEKTHEYKGKYHVLGGLISPLEGIGPEDININKLISRIDGDKVNEIILALKPSIEGETTMQYIKKLLENKNVKVTRIATGIPIGTDIEYIDPMTLEFALEGRKDI